MHIDSARKYGLVTGGPEGINVDRCEEILKRAAAQGINPRPVEDLMREYLASSRHG